MPCSSTWKPNNKLDEVAFAHSLSYYVLPYISILEWGSWTACNDICGDQSIMKRERHRKCVDMCDRDKAEDKSKCTPINATMHNPPQVITTTETTDCVPCPVDRKYTHMTYYIVP